MYNWVVPFQSGLAYSGCSGFMRPTLKTYLNWWHTHENALILKEDESEWLVYLISGSPLSGANNCLIVNKDGGRDWENIIPFAAVYTSFIAANHHWDEDGCGEEVYTLREIVDILKNDNSGLDDNEVHIIFLRNELKKQKAWLNRRIDYLRDDIKKLKNKVMTLCIKELTAFMEEYNVMKDKVLAKDKKTTDSIHELRRQLKAGEIDNKQYQRQLTPLKKVREDAKYKLSSLDYLLTDVIFPDYKFSISEIEEFLKQNSYDRN